MFEGAFESTDCFLKRERYIVYNEAIEIKKTRLIVVFRLRTKKKT